MISEVTIWLCGLTRNCTKISNLNRSWTQQLMHAWHNPVSGGVQRKTIFLILLQHIIIILYTCTNEQYYQA